ncbi:hypothetical protein HY450_00265 [Candidatus Pacearchaeota archaeon]|nr:hypothetical protein [Candidatus Pacearchaeota archaeon]
MENETKIIDEFDKLQKEKQNIEGRIEEVRKIIIELAKETGKEAIFGADKFCSVKEFEKVVYPENKDELIKMIRKKGLYDALSSINYFKLSPKILKREIDQEIIDLTKREKDYRVSLKDKNVLAVS